jgi:hypothetical protein
MSKQKIKQSKIEPEDNRIKIPIYLFVIFGFVFLSMLFFIFTRPTNDNLPDYMTTNQKQSPTTEMTNMFSYFQLMTQNNLFMIMLFIIGLRIILRIMRSMEI